MTCPLVEIGETIKPYGKKHAISLTPFFEPLYS